MSRRLLHVSVNIAVQNCLAKSQCTTNFHMLCKDITNNITDKRATVVRRAHYKEEHIVSGGSSTRVMLQPSPQELLVQNTVSRAESFTPADWVSLRDRVLSSEGRLQPTTLDAYIMSQCARNCNLNLGLSLLTYLERTASGPNLATLGAFFRLWHASEGYLEEKELLSRYDNLRKRYPLLDAATCESAAMALSCTTRWKDAIQLLDMIKLTQHPKSAVYTSLAVAAFCHGDIVLGHSLMEEAFEREDRRPGTEAYLAWLQHSEPEGLLHFFAAHGDRPSEKVAQALSDSLKHKGAFQANFTTVNKRGVCQSCGKQLVSELPTAAEFQQLQRAMLDRVLLSGDVFLKTSPQELVHYQEMLTKSGSWDVIIDGLNVAFASASSSPNIRAKLLLLVVQHFWNQRKKVLVLGRKHMKQWPKREMMSIYSCAQLFLADNLSQDDPLVLLAALHSGLGTKVVSRDLMRTHMFLLKDKKLRSIFQRWQYSHQCFFEIQNRSRVVIKDPLPFHPFAQQHPDGSWHLPYEVTCNSPNKRYNHLEVPAHWLCLLKVEDRM